MEGAKQRAPANDVVVELFGAEPDVPPLTADEISRLRQMLQEFAIVRATCPMAVRALSTRPLPRR